MLSDGRDLEKAVEDLSELLESPIEAENIPTLRQKVTDKTVCVASSFYCVSRLAQLLFECVRSMCKSAMRSCWKIRRLGSWMAGGSGMWRWMGLMSRSKGIWLVDFFTFFFLLSFSFCFQPSLF